MVTKKCADIVENFAGDANSSKRPLHFISQMPSSLSVFHYQQHTENIKVTYEEWGFLG